MAKHQELQKNNRLKIEQNWKMKAQCVEGDWRNYPSHNSIWRQLMAHLHRGQSSKHK